MTDFLLLAFTFPCAGVIAVPIASRFGLGSVFGYLIAGIVISPLLALLHVDVVSIQHFAEFGVVMVLFLVGLELEPKMLWEMRNRLLGLGGLQVARTTAAVAGGVMLFGQPFSIALAIGLVRRVLTKRSWIFPVSSLPDHLTPEKWLAHLFASREVTHGGVVR